MKVKWHQQSLAKEPPTHPPPLLKAPTDVKQTRTQVLMHCMGLYTMSVLQTLLMAKWSKASPSHFFFIFLMQKTKHRSKQKISHSKNKVKQKWSLDLKSDLLIKSHRKAGLWLKSLHLLVPRCSRNSISHAVPLALVPWCSRNSISHAVPLALVPWCSRNSISHAVPLALVPWCSRNSISHAVPLALVPWCSRNSISHAVPLALVPWCSRNSISHAVPLALVPWCSRNSISHAVPLALVPWCSRNSISHAVPLALGSTVYSKNYGIFQSPLTDQRFRSNRHFEQKLPQLSRANALTTHNGHIPQLSQTSQQTGSIDRLLPSREPVYEQANVNERREKPTKLTKVVFVF